MTLPALYAILVGLLMIGQWIFFLRAGQVPELQTEPMRIRFHLAAEFLTAGALILSGIGLLSGVGWAKSVYPLALGMVIYTEIQSPGYFADKRMWPLVGMFAVLLLLALASVLTVLTS